MKIVSKLPLLSHEDISALKDDLLEDENRMNFISFVFKHEDLVLVTLADRTFTLRINMVMWRDDI